MCSCVYIQESTQTILLGREGGHCIIVVVWMYCHSSSVVITVSEGQIPAETHVQYVTFVTTEYLKE